MISSNDEVRIGITIDLDIGIFSNGLQQNILFLFDLLSKNNKFNPYLIYKGEGHKNKFVDPYKCIELNSLFQQEDKFFDVLILMGYSLSNAVLKKIKDKGEIKIILMQCGNQVHYDMDNSLHKTNNNPIKPLYEINEIWTLPHHSINKSYLKTYNKCNDVIEVPYIWNSKILDTKLEELNLLKDQVIQSNLNKSNILIMEPNFSFTKNYLIPLFIVESYEHKNPCTLNKCTILGGTHLTDNDFFMNLIINSDIYKNRKDFLFVKKRKEFLPAIIENGSIIITHQIQNELNNLYFDCLYLNLPIIHNSRTISNAGYYYEENNINRASELLNEVINNHNKEIKNYEKKSKSIINSYDINNISNQNKYNQLIYKLI